MSISSEITRITGNIASAYTAVSGKGGTLPSARNSANLPAAIQSIPSGKPEQSKTLTLGAAAPSTVTPDSGKVLSSVPVVLDTSVIKAENIKKDVTMLGITGTHEGGGGGRGEYLGDLGYEIMCMETVINGERVIGFGSWSVQIPSNAKLLYGSAVDAEGYRNVQFIGDGFRSYDFRDGTTTELPLACGFDSGAFAGQYIFYIPYSSSFSDMYSMTQYGGVGLLMYA